MRIKSIVSLCVISMLASCASWNAVENEKPAPLPIIGQAQNNLSIIWQNDIGKPIAKEVGQAMLASIGADILVASNKEVSRINTQMGNLVWKIETKKIHSGLAANDKYIALINKDSQLTILNANNGSQIWQTNLDTNIISAPFIVDNIVVLRSSGNKLIAYNLDTQKLVWQYERPASSLLLYTKRNAMLNPQKGSILAGFHNAKIVELDSKTGMQKWEQTLSYSKGFTESERINDIVSSPVIYGQTSCAVSYQGKIGCFDVANGELSWEAPFSSTNNLLNDNEALYATTTQDYLSAFDYSGKQKWQQTAFKNRKLSDGILLENTLIFNDYKGFLHLLDKNTGAITGRFELGGSNTTPMLKVGSMLIIHANNGKLYGLKLNK